MSTETLDPRRGKVDWRRAEFVLTALGFLGFFTLPIRITTIYSGLPAHPLFLHIPVMLVPITALCAIACVIRPQWFPRYGIALSVVSIVAMSSIFLTMRAGSALEQRLGLNGDPLIQTHSHDAKILAVLYVAFTAITIITFASHRISGGMPTGLGVVDRLLSPALTVIALRVLLVLLALGSVYMCFKTGDAGAKAVWQSRLAHPGLPGLGGPPGANGINGLFAPNGG